jgi:hypothetical protein
MQGVGAQQGMQGGGGISNNAVVGPQYCLPQVSSFAVSRKGMSMSGGDWEIKDATGRTVFKVSVSVVTVRDKKCQHHAAAHAKEGRYPTINQSLHQILSSCCTRSQCCEGKEVFVMIWIVCVFFACS